ncbi:MAG: hypothetical protein P8N02_05395 [Actinomycetota bacterium]|nr:hypothetical protein [Actinomycetota bacterium]
MSGVGYSVGLSGSRAVVGSISADSGQIYFFDLSGFIGPASECDPPAPPRDVAGYWMLSAAGGLYPFGDAAELVGEVDLSLMSGERALTVRSDPSGAGVWVLTSTGRIIALGGAPHHGDAYGTPPTGSFFAVEDGAEVRAAASARFTTFATAPGGSGYWIFTDHGDVLPFGSVAFHGSLSGVELNGPVIDSAATTSGRGYWMLGSDGGVFTFSDPDFLGSLSHLDVGSPVASIAPVPGALGGD